MDILATLFLGLTTLLLGVVSLLLLNLKAQLKVVIGQLTGIEPQLPQVMAELQAMKADTSALYLSKQRIERLQLPWTDTASRDRMPRPPVESGTNLTELAFYLACAVNYLFAGRGADRGGGAGRDVGSKAGSSDNSSAQERVLQSTAR